MGQFSWIYSDTEKQVVDNKTADTYLLVPKPFQEKYGKSIYESCYDGYGRFGKYDVYALIAEWNKGMIPEIIRRIKNGNWKCSTGEKDITEYPIKITSKEMEYEHTSPSKSDPNQGWEENEEDDEEDYEEDYEE